MDGWIDYYPQYLRRGNDDEYNDGDDRDYDCRDDGDHSDHCDDDDYNNDGDDKDDYEDDDGDAMPTQLLQYWLVPAGSGWLNCWFLDQTAPV